jgi:1,4-alpha-glucan branching enzyme
MGSELAQEREWSHDRSLDWHLLDIEEHRSVQRLVAELNRVEADHPALWEADFSPEGFRWLDSGDRAASVYAFARSTGKGNPDLVCVANMTPVPRYGYRVGLPARGRWREVLNTDAASWGGSNVLNEDVATDDTAWQGCAQSAVLTLPPLAVVWLARESSGSPSR